MARRSPSSPTPPPSRARPQQSHRPRHRPDGTLYIADTGNNRVLSLRNRVTGLVASGLSTPTGLAVDGADNLYIANRGAGTVLTYIGDVLTTLTIPNITTPSGLAIDPSGSLFVAGRTTGNIVRVPNEAGVLNPADATTILTNPKSAYSVSLDAAGNLYTAAASVTFANRQVTGTSALVARGGASGNPIVFSILSGPGTVTGNQLSITGGGTIIIAADQAGNTNYAAATEVTRSVVVNLNPQNITFPPPASPIAYTNNPISLTATGGASGNPVTISVVSGPATVSGNQLSLTGLGTVVIAANQAGNSNYSAATQVTQSIVVVPIGTVATPTFSLTPGLYYQLQRVQLSDATANALLYYMLDGSTPTAASTQYTSMTNLTGGISISTTTTINVIAILPGYTSSTAPTFTYAFTPTSLTVTHGQTGTVNIVITPMNGFNQVVSFGCSDLPPGASCSFSPTTVATLPTQAPVSTVLTLTAPPTVSQLEKGPGSFSNRILPGMSVASLLMLLGFRKRRTVRLLALACFLSLGLTMVSGCGSASTTNNLTPVTVSMSGGSVRQSVVINLTVQ